MSYNAKAIGTVQFVYDGRDFVSPVQPPEMVKRVPTLLERGAELRGELHMGIRNTFSAITRTVLRPLWRQIPLSWRYHLRWRWSKEPVYEFMSPKQKKRLVAQLTTRPRSGQRRSLWFLPSHTWFSSSFQRPQQMAIALSEAGCDVVYWEPWELQEHLHTAESARKRQFAGRRRIGERLQLLRCPAEAYLELMEASQPEWVLFYWPYQAKLIPPGLRSRTIYEMIDDHSLERVDDDFKSTHAHWLKKADIVVGTADELVKQLRVSRTDALLVPNGVRAEDWSRVAPYPVPRDLVEARCMRVVVGYYGAIADWLDSEMWLAAARERPAWAFVWIGYPYGAQMEAEISRVNSLPNTFYLGRKPYHQLPAYLAHFDVATIPFKLNPITHACSPIKLFEFMAAGKPVVATPMREILKYQSVLFANSTGEFVAQIERALELRKDPGRRRLLLQEAKANTWSSRARELCRAMGEISKGN